MEGSEVLASTTTWLGLNLQAGSYLVNFISSLTNLDSDYQAINCQLITGVVSTNISAPPKETVPVLNSQSWSPSMPPQPSA